MRREPKTYDNIFRAKEKRTAMEAEESFALPKIDEIETSLTKGRKAKNAKNDADAPVLEDKSRLRSRHQMLPTTLPTTKRLLLR